MEPFTLEWWLRKQIDCVIGAEFSWAQYRKTGKLNYRERFMELWTLVHWITDRIINKYGE